MSANIEDRIIIVRSQRVIIDSDLAALYGVTTKRLNEQVKRNLERFPDDFMFHLEYQEVAALWSQISTSKPYKGGRRYLPFVFTEHGAVMAANILNSKVAINSSILLVRTFIKMRMMLTENTDFKRRLQDLERKLAQGFSQYEQELQEIRFLIAKLEAPIEPPKKRIGF